MKLKLVRAHVDAVLHNVVENEIKYEKNCVGKMGFLHLLMTPCTFPEIIAARSFFSKKLPAVLSTFFNWK